MAVAEAALSLLAGGKMKLLGLMPRASNYTFLTEIGSDQDTLLAVYKPRDGETPLWDFPDGTLCRREVAAYVVSEALGFGIVPPTLLRDGPHGFGSAQLFVEATPGEHYLSLAETHDDAFRRVAAFDIVTNNADRKSGHCLLEKGTDRIQVVDHGVSFHESPKLRTVIWDFAGEPLPPDIVEALERFLVSLKGETKATLEPLLSAAEVKALESRTKKLLKAGAFPEPGPGRPYPWPPV